MAVKLKINIMVRVKVNVKVKVRNSCKIAQKADKKIKCWNSNLWIRDKTKCNLSKREYQPLN
jgi:hypothetical protein